MLSGLQDASSLLISACHLSSSPLVSWHICTQTRAQSHPLRVSCLASRIIIILIIILMSSGQLMIKRVISSPAQQHTSPVTHVFSVVMGQQSSEKERFYTPCKSNFCRSNFTKICSNFPADLQFGHLTDYKITPLPQFMVPCSSSTGGCCMQ